MSEKIFVVMFMDWDNCYPKFATCNEEIAKAFVSENTRYLDYQEVDLDPDNIDEISRIE